MEPLTKVPKVGAKVLVHVRVLLFVRGEGMHPLTRCDVIRRGLAEQGLQPAELLHDLVWRAVTNVGAAISLQVQVEVDALCTTRDQSWSPCGVVELISHRCGPRDLVRLAFEPLPLLTTRVFVRLEEPLILAFEQRVIQARSASVVMPTAIAATRVGSGTWSGGSTRDDGRRCAGQKWC